MEELAIVRWFGAHRLPLLDWIAWLLGWAGRSGALWLALGAIGLARRRMKAAAAWQVLLALLLSMLVTDVTLKPLTQRERPYERDASLAVIGPVADSPSFPSGHASSSVAGAVALTRGWPGGGVAWWLLALAVSLGRLYAGVHYPTDVLAGAAVGLLCGFLVVGRTSWYILGSGSRTSGVAR